VGARGSGSSCWTDLLTSPRTTQTRAMALEVDALVRSIEDEKIDEEAREKVTCSLRWLIPMRSS
jgi:hypothetical protein